MTRGGWSSPQMVVRYQHTSPERDAHIASEMDRRLDELLQTSRPFAFVPKDKDKDKDKDTVTDEGTPVNQGSR